MLTLDLSILIEIPSPGKYEVSGVIQGGLNNEHSTSTESTSQDLKENNFLIKKKTKRKQQYRATKGENRG